jgi:hypothetical protein
MTEDIKIFRPGPIGLLNERLEETTMPSQARESAEATLQVEEEAARKQAGIGWTLQNPAARLFSDSLRIDDRRTFPIGEFARGKFEISRTLPFAIGLEAYFQNISDQEPGYGFGVSISGHFGDVIEKPRP